MTPQQIMDGMSEKNRQLTFKNDEYQKLSERFAYDKKCYRIAKAKRMLELKLDKHSVTMIQDLAKGDSVVADLKYKMDVSEGVMKACQESIKDLRTAIDSYRSLLTWLREEKVRS